MLAPHAVDIAVIILSLIASLCFTFVEPFDDIFRFVKSSCALVSVEYKQNFTTQGRKEGASDRSIKRVNSPSLT